MATRTLTAFLVMTLAGCNFIDADPTGGPGNGGDATGTTGQSAKVGCYPGGGTLDAYAICLCEDFAKVGRVTTHRGPSQLPASVGVNGRSDAVDLASIDGSWHAYKGFHTIMSSKIADDLVTISDVR